MNNKASSRLNLKGAAVEFKDNDYETPKAILELIMPYIQDYNIIYDPFYCAGRVIDEWAALGKTCINEKLDAFNRTHPQNYDIIISNIPFSIKKQSMKLFMDLNKPFIILMPIDAMGSKWIKEYWDKLQFIIPPKRMSFTKDGVLGKGAWFDTCFYCYGLNMDKTIIKL